jgi:diguanylate cyclase (GGDEF)-like protein
MFAARSKPQFSTTDVFPLTDAIMDFDDSAAEVVRLSRREVDVRRLPGQRTLFQKWLIAISLVSLYLMVVVVFHALGMVQTQTVMVLGAMIGGGLLLFLAVFKSGLNRKFSEKRLKFPIVACALGGLLVVFYLDPVTQIALAPFAFVALAYGMYRIQRVQAYLLGFLFLAGYATVVALHYWEQQNEALLRLELMHLLALGAAIPAFLFLIAKVQLLHHILHRASRKIKNIQEDAQRDTFLGCFNRRYIVAALEEQRQVADETGIPLCLAVIDLDHFKRINDELGHLAGSRAVCRFAETMRSTLRDTDTAARYGGDEFVVVLTETELDGAMLVVRRTVERLASDPDQPRLSVSAGIAVYPKDGHTPTTLLSAADRALYANKAQKAQARRRNLVDLQKWTSAS